MQCFMGNGQNLEVDAISQWSEIKLHKSKLLRFKLISFFLCLMKVYRVVKFAKPTDDVFTLSYR